MMIIYHVLNDVTVALEIFDTNQFLIAFDVWKY